MTNHHSGTWTAHMELKNAKIQKKVHQIGPKKVMYGFTLSFDKKEMPSIEIYQKIKGSQHYEFFLDALSANLERMEGPIQEICNKKTTLLGRINKLKKDREKLKVKKEFVTKRLQIIAAAKKKKEEMAKKNNDHPSIDAEFNEIIASKEQEIPEITHEIKEKQEEILEKTIEIKALKKEQKRYAFIIHKKKEIPHFLVELGENLHLAKQEAPKNKGFGRGNGVDIYKIFATFSSNQKERWAAIPALAKKNLGIE